MADHDVVELNQLAYRYGAAVDACDGEAFLSVFTPTARLRSYHPAADEPFADLIGHAQLATIPDAMRGMFRHTAHMMTNHLVTIDGERASGSILCTARHLSENPAIPAVLVVVLRYIDRYERDPGGWRIADRQIRFLWSERHEVVESGFAAAPESG
jgi:hypothetical protein